MLEYRRTRRIVIIIKYEKTKEINIVTNYSQTLEKMIQEGKYTGYILPYMEDEGFLPYSRRVAGSNEPEQMAAVLFQFFNGLTACKDIVKVMSKEGYVPANLAELLAYGRIYPNEQHEKTIVALGSISQTTGQVASLKTVYGSKEEIKWIDLNPIWDNPFKRGFDEFWSFLAVRKKE